MSQAGALSSYIHTSKGNIRFPSTVASELVGASEHINSIQTLLMLCEHCLRPVYVRARVGDSMNAPTEV